MISAAAVLEYLKITIGARKRLLEKSPACDLSRDKIDAYNEILLELTRVDDSLLDSRSIESQSHNTKI